MSRRLSHLLVPCAVFFAACADSVISPESEADLTRDDAQFVAEMIDATTAGLLTDLEQRGLLEDTLVVWGGEFGRTPMAQGNGVGYGRDHHPHGFTMWMAGGGVKPGIVHGATDELGYFAIKDRVHVHDFNATILHLLGLDHERLSYYHNGINRRLTDVHGHVIKEVLA